MHNSDVLLHSPSILYEYKGFVPAHILGPGRTLPLVEHKLKDVALNAGFYLDDDKDNKSVVSVEQMFKALLRYSPKPPKYNGKLLDQAIDLAFSVFGGDGTLSPLTSKRDLYHSLRLDRSSGVPYFESKEAAFEKDWKHFERLRNPKNKFKPFPCVAFHRVQHGSLGPKTRLVWGFPQSMTLFEAQFARPLIDKYLSINTPMAFGLRKAEIAARSQIINDSDIRVGLDVSGFDASVSPRLIRVAFRILRTWFGELSDTEAYWFDKIQWYFINTPILMPDGNVWVKHLGVPSGSYFTQLVDSIVNFILVQYLRLRDTGVVVSPKAVLVLGDDSITRWPHLPSLPKLARFAREVGFELNTEKSEISHYPEGFAFLGHHWVKGLPSRDIYDLVKRAVYPERVARIDDGPTRRHVRLAGLAGDSLEGAPLLDVFSTGVIGLLRGDFRISTDDLESGLLTGLRVSRDVEIPKSLVSYMLKSLLV